MSEEEEKKEQPVQKKEEVEQDRSGAWLVSYADLMTLLFATFVVLYGLKSQGEIEEMRGVVSSIRESFVDIPDIIDDPSVGPSTTGFFVMKNWKGEKSPKKLIKRFKRNEVLINLIEEDSEKLRKIMQKFNLEKKNFQIKKSNDISLHQEGEFMIVRIAASILYKNGDYHLKQKQLLKLNPIFHFLKDIQKPVRLEVFTNNKDYGLNKLSGLKLSSMRASYLLRYLTSKSNISGFEISPYGYLIDKNQNFQDRLDIKIDYSKKNY